MKNRIIALKYNKDNYLIILLSFFILIIALFYRQPLYGIFGVKNYLSLHLIIEFFIVTISFAISIQSWITLPHILSSYRLGIGALFFSLGILELAHTITYRGMPFFISASSIYKATWFFTIGRLTAAFGILVIIVSKERTVSSKSRLLAYSVAVLYSAFWLVMIFLPSHFLPQLVKEGTGTTSLKNNLEYAASVIQLAVIYFAAVRYRNHEVFTIMLIIASIYMIIEDYFFTTYKDVYDINNFLGHWFQLAGYYFLLRAVYHTSVEEPFAKQKEALEKIQYMAFHDDLTELPNLRFLKEEWAKIIERKLQRKAAFLVIDIDRFKNINEALGHIYGDMVLQAAAARLQETLAANMILGRITGDQFAVIMPEVEENAEIAVAAGKIQSSLVEPLKAPNILLKINVCIGGAIFPDNGADLDKLLQRANMAMLDARKENQCFQFFQPEMDGQALEMLVFENDLYHALSRKELFLVYQPQVNFCKGEVIGIEALLRWRHPERGYISPDKFIPIAEKTGLIIPIGEWVLRTACRQLKEWQDSGLPLSGVAVNLSTRQFYQQNLADTIMEILKDTQLSPQYLELEITESMIMNVEYTMSTLEKLKQLGIRIAIDDFGTGYSSLSYLKNLPVDRLKIDQSFVRDLNEGNASVVSMIISLAEHLKINVIAEGVETAAQKQILHAQKCCEMQGFGFSPPIKPDEFMETYRLLCEKMKINA